jgi:membrane carboxypeptidase/penicillin-binding protein
LVLKLVSKIRKIKIDRIKLKLKLVLILSILLFLTFTFYLLIIKDLPSPKALTDRNPEVSTKIYDRNGNLLYKIEKDKNRSIVPVSKIPKNIQLATLAAEDAEFYNHPGFSIKGISRAMISNFNKNSLQGGSTITQQLVKNVLLTPEKTITRKIKELILSIEVEANYSKDQILEMYMNEVSYGGTAYGIEEAAESYFGKSTEELSLAEGSFLAGLPKSPTLYSPFGQNPDLAFERQREVLHLMNLNKFISEEDEQMALNTSLTFVPNKTEIKAPHFVMNVRQLLVERYGEDMVEKGGLEVTTTLDLPTQIASEKIVGDEVDKLKGLNVGNGAAIVINPQNGEILTMVGSKNYFDIGADGNVNVTLRLRQPGSSIKVVNYAYALSHDFTPASIIDDSKITYVTPGSAPYSPVNYDGKFLGKITLRSALAQSRNIPAVKLLASYGVDKMIDIGKSMVITTWDNPSNYGLSLTLGGGAVKMIDLAQVYSVIANYGKRQELVTILQVKDYKGMILENKRNRAIRQILDPRLHIH